MNTNPWNVSPHDTVAITFETGNSQKTQLTREYLISHRSLAVGSEFMFHNMKSDSHKITLEIPNCRRTLQGPGWYGGTLSFSMSNYQSYHC